MQPLAPRVFDKSERQPLPCRHACSAYAAPKNPPPSGQLLEAWILIVTVLRLGPHGRPKRRRRDAAEMVFEPVDPAQPDGFAAPHCLLNHQFESFVQTCFGQGKTQIESIGCVECFAFVHANCP